MFVPGQQSHVLPLRTLFICLFCWNITVLKTMIKSDSEEVIVHCCWWKVRPVHSAHGKKRKLEVLTNLGNFIIFQIFCQKDTVSGIMGHNTLCRTSELRLVYCSKQNWNIVTLRSRCMTFCECMYSRAMSINASLPWGRDVWRSVSACIRGQWVLKHRYLEVEMYDVLWVHVLEGDEY